MNITLLNKNIITKTNKASKAYQTVEVAYKNNTFGGKVEGFKVTQYMKGFAGINEANIGDTLDVEVVKNEGGFNEWVSVSKGSPTAAAPASATKDPRQATPTVAGRVGYVPETPEERAKKQVYIVRQSSISAAISALSIGAKSPLKAEDVKVLAKQFERYVFDMSGATGFDDVPDLDPSFAQEPQIE